MVRGCDTVPGACMQVCEEQYFWTFDLIDDNYAFISVFRAINTVVGNIDNLHSNIIEQADFCYLHPFGTTVIH